MGGRILGPGSLRLMSSARILSTGVSANYGCGLTIRRLDDERIWTHGGSISGFLLTNTMIPRYRSAVILLTNAEHLNPLPIHDTILHLLIKDLKTPEAPAVPKVAGPPPREAALDFLHQMQAGRLDRGKLGDEFDALLTADRVKSAAPRLKALGEPESIDVLTVSERGGMEVATILFHFKTAELRCLLYRSPDGKIQQLLFRKG